MMLRERSSRESVRTIKPCDAQLVRKKGEGGRMKRLTGRMRTTDADAAFRPAQCTKLKSVVIVNLATISQITGDFQLFE